MKYKNKINFKSILKKYRYQLNPGDIVAGFIKYQEFQGFLIDIGDNIAGYLPFEEIKIITKENDYNIDHCLYLTREFFLIKHNIKYKESILSIKRLEYMRAWKRIQEIDTEDIVLTLQIYNINKGGIITHVEGIQGFIPNSHQYIIQKNSFNIKKNKKIQCKLLMISQNNNEIILSQKSALLHLSKHKFRFGELIYGTIISIENYGIFIDVYGILGLLHISEISLSYIENIHIKFYIGQIIKVKIIHINKKQGRLSISTKHL
uniref:Ribosomal protein S1 n=1 Tax=Spermothamnion repens TaxID=31383 RepID=A0A4D6X1I4_9FLOR|nr:ribosomal protein S1 [Spermothamnion repens]